MTLALVALVVVAGWAQPATTVRGRLVVTVVDRTQAVVPGATVSLRRGAGETATVEERQTDARGVAEHTVESGEEYDLHVTLPGFVPRQLRVRPREAVTSLRILLQIAAFSEAVVVTPDPRQNASDPRGLAFRRVLGPEELASLPDDPEALAEALRAIAGPGARFEVDGFSAGRLPPKAAIQQIRIGMGDYSAEYHQYTPAMVEIETKPGAQGLAASVSARGTWPALNARDFFARHRGATSQGSVNAFVMTPVERQKSTLMASLTLSREVRVQPVHAIVPAGPVDDQATQASNGRLLWLSFARTLPRYHVTRFWYEQRVFESDNVGVGGLTLPERAMSTRLSEHTVRVSESGVIFGKVFSRLRVDAVWSGARSTAASDAPAVVVLGGFTGGGAQTGGGRDRQTLRGQFDVDMARGRQAVRLGLWLAHDAVESDAWENRGGTYTYASVADYAAGVPLQYSQRTGEPRVSLAINRLAAFVQDDVRVSDRLTLSAGLRIERQSFVSAGLTVAPRAGLSWSPSASGRTSIRLGGGRYLDWVDVGVFEQAAQSDGVHQREVVTLFTGGSSTSVEPRLRRLQVSPDIVLPSSWRVGAAIEHRRHTVTLRADYAEVLGRSHLRGWVVGPTEAAAPILVEARSTGESRERRLQVSVNTKPSAFVIVNAGYTLSSNVADGDGAFTPAADASRRDLEFGPSAGDATHRFYVSGFASVLRRRVQVAVSAIGSSGTPYSIQTGRDDNRDGFVIDRPASVPRNSARGGASWMTNVQIGWLIPIRGTMAASSGLASTTPSSDAMTRRRLRVSVNVTNALNLRNPVGYVGVVGSPLFGQPVGAQPSRSVYVALGFDF